MKCLLLFNILALSMSVLARAEKAPEENYLSTCIYRLQKKVTHLENKKYDLENKEKELGKQKYAFRHESDALSDKIIAYCEKKPNCDYDDFRELANYNYAKYKFNHMDELDKLELKKILKSWETDAVGTESHQVLLKNIESKYKITQESLYIYTSAQEKDRSAFESKLRALDADGLNLINEQKALYDKYPDIEIALVDTHRQIEFVQSDIDALESSLKIYNQIPQSKREWPSFMNEKTQSAPQYPKQNQALDKAEMDASKETAAELIDKAKELIGKQSKRVTKSGKALALPSRPRKPNDALRDIEYLMNGLKPIVEEAVEEAEANQTIVPKHGEVPEKNKEVYDKLSVIKRSLLELKSSHDFLEQKRTNYENSLNNIKITGNLIQFLLSVDWTNPPLSCQAIDHEGEDHWQEDLWGMTDDEIAKNKALKKYNTSNTDNEKIVPLKKPTVNKRSVGKQ